MNTDEPTTGPLRVHPGNPRYFTDGTRSPDGSLRAVYLTGSHTWPNLIDRGLSDPPPAFDYRGYLDLLQQHNHNFIRLWGRHVTWYHDYAKPGDCELYASPLAWPRTGPGLALDGKPRFDLACFNQAYFDRLRSRVSAAQERGTYVGIMLFGGSYECKGGWQGNPFNKENNINGIDGDPNGDGNGLRSHTLEDPAITHLQEVYVQKVIDTVNDLDNVLYEISNEGAYSSKEWQYHMIRFIRDHELGKPKQHPVGMTCGYPEEPAGRAVEVNKAVYASPADWVSPHTYGWRDGVRNPPPADGTKVSILDSDHWWIFDIFNDPVFGREWVWKSFCRGHNPIMMEHLPPNSAGSFHISLDDPGHVASRIAMGQTRRYAQRMNLAAMLPRNDLASSEYCLADPGREYLVYLPAGGPISVDLTAAGGELTVEWFDPAGDAATVTGVAQGGACRRFQAPFAGEAVLYLKAS